MALYIPVYLLLWRIIDRRFRWPAVITVPLVFVPLEYIRGTFLQGGMAWFYASRRKHLDEYVRQTPAWVLDAQRAGLVI